MPRPKTKTSQAPESFQGLKPLDVGPYGAPFGAVTLALGWVIFLSGILTAIVTAVIVYRTFSPFLVADQWTILSFLMDNDHLSIKRLWAQHNEHRIPWGRLAEYLDLAYFGGRNVSLILEIFLVRSLEASFLIWMFRRYSGCNKPTVLTAAGFFLFSTFYPLQIENFYWGSQIVFVCLPFAACMAFGLAVIHVDSVSSQNPRPWFSWALGASLIAAFFAETSLASGIFVWPLLLLLSFIYRMPWKTNFLIGCIGAGAIAAYLWGYNTPGWHANPVDSMRHPITMMRYVAIYMGWSWDPTLPTGSLWPTFFQLFSLSAIGFVIISLLITVFPKTKPHKLQVFFSINLLFLLITSFVTALGRINFGEAGATASRYQTIALAFWSSFLGLLLLRLGKSRNPPRLMEIQAVLMLLLLASIPRFISAGAAAEERQVSLMQGWQQLSKNPSAITALYPGPIPDLYRYLQSHHLGPGTVQPALDETPTLGSAVPIASSESSAMHVNGFEILPSSKCTGFLDLVAKIPKKPGGIAAAGWAWSPASVKRPGKVLLALDDGSVIATTDVTIPRPDVQKAFPNISDLNVGWMVDASSRPGATLRAFLISDDSKAVCPLSNAFKLP